MKKFNISKVSAMHAVQWVCSRVAVIYLVLFIFSLTCIDLKMFSDRIKVRHLNQAIPNFTEMVNFSMGQDKKQVVNWAPYKNYFELILRYMPDDVVARQLLGVVDFYAGHKEKAIALFKSSVDLKGRQLFWSNYNLGVIYYKKGMWSQAAEYLLKAISINPQLSIFLMKSSIIYKQIFSIPGFTYSLEEGIDNAKSKAYILLLSSLHSMGQYDKMMVISKLAIPDPKVLYKDEIYYYTGLAFYEAGQFQEAFLLFQKSLTIEKNNPDVYYYIANIYQKAGRLEESRNFFQVSYALHQKNDPRFPFEAHVELGFL